MFAVNKRDIAASMINAVLVFTAKPFLLCKSLYSVKYAVAAQMKNMVMLNQSAFAPKMPV